MNLRKLAGLVVAADAIRTVVSGVASFASALAAGGSR